MEISIAALLREGAERLRAAGLSDGRAEAALLLGDLLSMDRLRMLAAEDDGVAAEHATAFRERIARRAGHEPVAYILGYRDFYNARFRVNPGVLIPRPETEALAELALQARHLPTDARVLDLCCGSGCVGISLQQARPDWRVTCSDISTAALAVARENGDTILGTDREWPAYIHSDLFAELDDSRFDAILCNPPYIHPEEAGDLARDLTFEPDTALYHSDPLAFNERIVFESAERMDADGLFVLETSPRWTARLREVAASVLHDVRVLSDLGGLERIITGRKRAK